MDEYHTISQVHFEESGGSHPHFLAFHHVTLFQLTSPSASFSSTKPVAPPLRLPVCICLHSNSLQGFCSLQSTLKGSEKSGKAVAPCQGPLISPAMCQTSGIQAQTIQSCILRVMVSRALIMGNPGVAYKWTSRMHNLIPLGRPALSTARLWDFVFPLEAKHQYHLVPSHHEQQLSSSKSSPAHSPGTLGTSFNHSKHFVVSQNSFSA